MLSNIKTDLGLNEGFVLLRRKSPYKSFVKSQIFSCDFLKFFVTMNVHYYKLLKSIINDVQTEDKGEFKLAINNYSKIVLHFGTIKAVLPLKNIK